MTAPTPELADAIFFYGGPLSSFAKRPIRLRPSYFQAMFEPQEFMVYTCREDFFQSSKAVDRAGHDFVLGDMRRTMDVKRRGQRVRLREDWEQSKYDLMLGCIRAELAQHPGLARALLSTGSRPIAENSPTDFIWGIRDRQGGYTGMNLLGKAWMQARDELEEQA